MNENYKNKIASLLTNSENIASKRIEYLINYINFDTIHIEMRNISNIATQRHIIRNLKVKIPKFKK